MRKYFVLFLTMLIFFISNLSGATAALSSIDFKLPISDIATETDNYLNVEYISPSVFYTVNEVSIRYWRELHTYYRPIGDANIRFEDYSNYLMRKNKRLILTASQLAMEEMFDYEKINYYSPEMLIDILKISYDVVSDHQQQLKNFFDYKTQEISKTIKILSRSKANNDSSLKKLPRLPDAYDSLSFPYTLEDMKGIELGNFIEYRNNWSDLLFETYVPKEENSPVPVSSSFLLLSCGLIGLVSLRHK